MMIITLIVIFIFIIILSVTIACVFLGIKEGAYNEMFDVVHKYYPTICFDDFSNLSFIEARTLYKRTKKELKEEARKRIIKELNTRR
ncbi:hypothetical protein [Campylobacter hyointestinalis]|uniref:hypothetical protein n=1 Tax=Campylobacter hyointestinalis TaxID=198 RepID=UPI0007259CF7|nr:hypothetical protein [Campylobacter hyointestinalis]CUU77276.1 Uncharacterised protein [Campylobacter hyointestinalis subsp. hyointestinalis]